MIKPGLVSKLRVLRQTDIGYMLTDDEFDDETKRLKEVFLHNNECCGRSLKDDEMVDAFIYFDNKNREAATLKIPLITQYQPGWVEVVNKVDFGVFINIGISKDILIDQEYLPYDKECWPEVNDKLFCILRPNKNTLIGKVVNEYDSYDFKKEEIINVSDTLSATVSKILKSGIALYTDSLSYIFVHKTQLRKKYRLGEVVLVTITKITDERIDGTLIKNKEYMIDDDSSRILEYLRNNKKMKYGNNSSPDEILKVFNMSKKAFKRALGHLYKERIIDFVDDYTILKEE